MKTVLLGIAIIFFGIAFIQAATGSAGAIGLGISVLGLIVALAGYLKQDKSWGSTKKAGP